ncbi:MAG: hypothetical protein MJ154_01750 [Candidatus Saccharibacteria bacterium]|nr:hypothetical protein [Candidatus Saccharibacteria bacterium]
MKKSKTTIINAAGSVNTSATASYNAGTDAKIETNSKKRTWKLEASCPKTKEMMTVAGRKLLEWLDGRMAIAAAADPADQVHVEKDNESFEVTAPNGALTEDQRMAVARCWVAWRNSVCPCYQQQTQQTQQSGQQTQQSGQTQQTQQSGQTQQTQQSGQQTQQTQQSGQTQQTQQSGQQTQQSGQTQQGQQPAPKYIWEKYPAGSQALFDHNNAEIAAFREKLRNQGQQS